MGPSSKATQKQQTMEAQGQQKSLSIQCKVYLILEPLLSKGKKIKNLRSLQSFEITNVLSGWIKSHTKVSNTKSPSIHDLIELTFYIKPERIDLV